MKFASAARAAGREGMRERHRRERMATPALRAHYPGLNALQLGFDFSDSSDFVPSAQVTVFHPPAPAFFRFACPYSDCDGEFNLTQLVELAVSSRDVKAGEIRCGGMRHRGVACTLNLEYSISPQWP